MKCFDWINRRMFLFSQILWLRYHSCLLFLLLIHWYDFLLLLLFNFSMILCERSTKRLQVTFTWLSYSTEWVWKKPHFILMIFDEWSVTQYSVEKKDYNWLTDTWYWWIMDYTVCSYVLYTYSSHSVNQRFENILFSFSRHSVVVLG